MYIKMCTDYKSFQNNILKSRNIIPISRYLILHSASIDKK